MQYDNSRLTMQKNPDLAGMEMGWRKPVFDILISAQKQNAYSKMAQNELALQLLKAGVFDPRLAGQSAVLLGMMDFNRKDELLQKVLRNGNALQMTAMWQRMALELAEKYEPETAEKMAGAVMEMAAEGRGKEGLSGSLFHLKRSPGGPYSEWMIRAREMARNVSQPG